MSENVDIFTLSFKDKRAQLILAIFVATFIFILIAGSASTMGAPELEGYAVLVDGTEVSFVEDKELVKEFIQKLNEEAREAFKMDVLLKEVVTFEEKVGNQFDDLQKVKDELSQLFTYEALAYMVVVNNTDVAPVGTLEEYQEVERIITENYSKSDEESILLAVTFKGDLSYRRETVFPDELRSPDYIATVLLTGADRRDVYLVSRGDSLWTIAQKNNMSLEEVQEANPHLKGHVIQPGDELNLVIAEPLLSVVIDKKITVTERIPYGTTYVDDSSMWTSQTKVREEGKYGEKELTYRVIAENGEEIEKELTAEKILSEPKNQVVARGTSRNPSVGTGQFAWPLAPGAGRVSSPYGWRNGRLHRGVDVAAPTGTAIRASDSGVVSISGWQGQYGNLVVIDHGNGYSTYYAHNSRNIVSRGEKVEKGQTIALVGTTGNTTGPHVHFEIRRNGEALNPMNFFNP